MNLKLALHEYCRLKTEGKRIDNNICKVIKSHFENLELQDVSSIEFDLALQYICCCDEYMDEVDVVSKFSMFFSSESVIYAELYTITLKLLKHLGEVSHFNQLVRMVDYFLIETGDLSKQSNSEFSLNALKLYLKLYSFSRKENRIYVISQLLKRVVSVTDKCRTHRGEIDQKNRMKVLCVLLKKDREEMANRGKQFSPNNNCKNVLEEASLVGSTECNATNDELSVAKVIFSSLSQLQEMGITFSIPDVFLVCEQILKVAETDADFKNMMLWYLLSLCQVSWRETFAESLRRILKYCKPDIITELCQEIMHMIKFDEMCQDPQSMSMMFAVIEVLKDFGATKCHNAVIRKKLLELDSIAW